MPLNREKLSALAAYIIWRTQDYSDFGAVKLNKVIWFAEARYNEASGKRITGETFLRQRFGPVPKHIGEILRELTASGKIERAIGGHYDREVQRFRAFEPVDMSGFDADELGMIDWWIRHVANDHTATTISELSHDYGWRLAKDGEELPLKAFLAKRLRPPREGEELDWARQQAAEIENS
jgi:hypothetical protein